MSVIANKTCDQRSVLFARSGNGRDARSAAGLRQTSPFAFGGEKHGSNRQIFLPAHKVRPRAHSTAHDIRYVVFVTEKVDNMGWILKEMNNQKRRNACESEKSWLLVTKRGKFAGALRKGLLRMKREKKQYE